MALTFSAGDRATRDARLGELVLYVSAKCADDARFGATKLNKILWWSDMLAFGEHGEPITGAEYQRLRWGPAPRRLLPVQQALIAHGDAAVSKAKAFRGYTQSRLVPLRDPDLSTFTAEQIALVDSVIARVWKATATGVSQLSHGKAWRIAEDGADIPYEAVFLSDEDPDQDDIEWARQVAAEHQWA